MPTTFTPGDERQDEKLNPGQQNADQRFNNLSQTEQRGTIDMSDFERNYGENADSSQEDANIEKLRNQEAASAPHSNWSNNVQQATGKPKRTKVWFKRAAPALGIGGLLGIGGFALLGLTTPGLLIVQMKEVMAEKFNTSLASSEIRSSKLLLAKTNDQTKGLCTTKLTLACKYSTMSKKQVEKFTKAGITVNGEPNALGRTKPTSFTFNDKTITAAEFNSVVKSDPAFRSALRKAYNPMLHTVSGRAWDAVSQRFKISKQLPELNANESEEKARARLNTIATEGLEAVNLTDSLIEEGDKKDPNCTGDDCAKWTKEEADTANQQAQERVKSGSTGTDVRSRLSNIDVEASGIDSVGNALKVTGVVDNACMIYGGLTALNYAAKAVRAAQLVRYAMVYLAIADAIKAGVSPDPDDVAYLGGILTAVTVNSTNPTEKLMGSATDSFGYKYSAFGDAGASPAQMNLANRFLAGGGMVGNLSSLTKTVTDFFPGGRQDAKNVCGTLANPAVQAGSIILGIAVLFLPGANVGKTIANAAISVSAGIAMSMLPQLLADIVAGTVTQDIKGEESGNAIVSGSGHLLGDTLAAQNGNAPMTKDDAIAYNAIQTTTNDQYTADTIAELSPFDASSRHTFLGSISSKLFSLQSSSNPISYIGSLLNSSFASLTPKTSAISDEDYRKSLDVCTDLDVIEAGLAADPFCNVIRGIPPQYVNRDIMDVANWMVANGHVTDEGLPLSEEYTKFKNDCIEAQEPLGYVEGTDYDVSAAQKCIINSTNANFYLFYTDDRIEKGMAGLDEGVGNNGGVLATGEYMLPVDPGYGFPGSGQDWGPRACNGCSTFHRGVDLTNYPGGSKGKPVYSVAAGEVVMATRSNGSGTSCAGGMGNSSYSTNNPVHIQHADGTIGVYLHMAPGDIKVNVGDKVTPGQQIGAINNCGQSFGAHLHFAVQLGSASDPKITAIEQNANGAMFLNPVQYMSLYGVDVMNGKYTDGR